MIHVQTLNGKFGILLYSTRVTAMEAIAIETALSGAIRENTNAKKGAYRGCMEARRYARTRSLSWPVVVSTRYGDTAHFMVSRTKVGMGRAFMAWRIHFHANLVKLT